jgi:hypothetical protein
MTELPPLIRDQRVADADHMRILAIFHFVFAGLAVLAIGFLGLHYLLFSSIMDNPDMWKNAKGGAPMPKDFFKMFRWFYVIFGALLILCAAANLLSGLFIRGRRHRTFSLIVAGLNCIQVPFGTTLGVFTFFVLLRPSVEETYRA